MKPYRDGDGVTLYVGDCLDVLPTLPAESVDAVVTDPPYGLGFMGKDWDHGIPGVHFWREVLRVAKPGAHLLACGGTRTYHRLVCAIEDAGWEIRDTVMWVYGSGFPKSLDVSKAIDKEAGADRRVLGVNSNGGRHGSSKFGQVVTDGSDVLVTAPATDAAKQWDGWGTALKPSWEPVTLARKPLNGTVASNVQRYGTGALNIDASRIPFDGKADEQESKNKNRRADFGTEPGGNKVYGDFTTVERRNYNPPGRWPANLIHDGSPEVVEGFPEQESGGVPPTRPAHDSFSGFAGHTPTSGIGASSGNASRFFYCAKASRDDRGEGNDHPTVKPLDLMRYLIRLITPPGGIVLDPFAGSGSTLVAAQSIGFRSIGIDLEEKHCAIAAKRLAQGVLDLGAA